jgi:protein phosphatase-4 regulatory subunit 3
MKRKNEVDNDDGDATPAADLEDDGDNMPSESSNASTKPATETHCDGQDQKQKQEGKEAQQRQQQKTQIKDTPEQPEGWRVKLYRLNGDGSWDDCGTGRISCLQKPTPSNNNNTNSIKGGINSNSNNNNGSSKSSNSTGNRSSPNYQHHHHQNSDVWAYHELGEPTLCMHSEVPNSNKRKSSNNTDNLQQQQQPASSSAAVPPESRILLRTRILLRDQYQRQGDNIITWCEPYSEEGTDHSQGVDLALSFQDNAGCLDIWRKIHQVQSRAADLFRRRSAVSSSNSGSVVTNDSSGSTEEKAKEKHNTGLATNGRGGSVADVAQAVAAAHHASIPRQEQCEMWVNVVSEAQQQQQQDGHGDIGNDNDNENDHVHDQFDDVTSPFQDMSGSASASGSSIAGSQQPQLPNPPTLANLEDIADTIAAVQHIQHKENLAMYIAQNDCSYLKSLLSLFPKAEDLGDYGSLATLAACVKTILLLNEPGIIELVVMDEVIFEEVCATLEYDPDLRDKADHRWFLRERVKFRTVTLMEDEELMSAIHRSFRVCYMRDTLLRPTMDENCLSTLSSLQTFTHADVVKGVTMSPVGSDDEGELLRDSYLAKVSTHKCTATPL